MYLIEGVNYLQSVPDKKPYNCFFGTLDGAYQCLHVRFPSRSVMFPLAPLSFLHLPRKLMRLTRRLSRNLGDRNYLLRYNNPRDKLTIYKDYNTCYYLVSIHRPSLLNFFHSSLGSPPCFLRFNSSIHSS
jgi:hypothetical protein